MIKDLSKNYGSAPIGQDSKDERNSASPRAQSIPPKDAALIDRINQFNGSAIEILRSIACLQINSSNNPAVHSAVGKKVTQLKELYPAEGAVINAFRQLFMVTMLAPPKTPQKEQPASQQVDESTKLDWPQSFGLHVKAPDVTVLRQFSGAKLLVEKCLRDMSSGKSQAKDLFVDAIAEFKAAAVDSLKDLTIAQLSLSCLFDTIAMLRDLETEARKSVDTSVKTSISQLAKDLCAECLKKHSLSATGLEKGDDISDKQIAAALLVFEFSATLMHDIPEGIGAVGYQPLLALLNDRRMTNERREAVITRLKILRSDSTFCGGLKEIAKALRAEGERLPNWLGEISHDMTESYVKSAGNSGEIKQLIEERHVRYRGYFAKLKKQTLFNESLEITDAIRERPFKPFVALVTKFCATNPNSDSEIAELRTAGLELFAECIYADALDYARTVLEKLVSIGAPLDPKKTGNILVNDFNPKLPAWRPWHNGVPLIIPTDEKGRAIHTTGTTSTSSASDTTNQNADRPMSQRDFSNVLRDVPLIVLDTAFCRERFQTIQSESRDSIFLIKFPMKWLADHVRTAIKETRTALTNSLLPDFSELEKLISEYPDPVEADPLHP